MDIVAVLTKALQEQGRIVSEQQAAIEKLNEQLTKMEVELTRVKAGGMRAGL